MQLEEALRMLDVHNDDHWTSDGLPRIEILSELTQNAFLKRGVVTKIAPKFTRKNPHIELVGEVVVDGGSSSEPPLFSPDPEPEPASESVPKTVVNEEKTELMLRRESLQDKIAELQSKINEITSQIACLNKERTGLQDTRIELEEEFNSLFPNSTNEGAIREYLKMEHEKRLQRYSQAVRVSQNICAPIDAVHRKPRGHGNKKVVYPFLNKT